MDPQRATGVVDRATRNDAFQYAARAGFVISGVLHLLIGYIIVSVAFGSGDPADQSGALAALASSGGGAPVLWATAIGLTALGLWRFAETVVGPHPTETSGEQEDPGIIERLKSFGTALAYLAIAYSAAKFATGTGQKSSTENAGLSARLMEHGWGKFLLVAAGLGIVGVGAYHVYKGATKGFLKDDLTVPGGPVITPVGIVGYVAKGVVLAGAGILVIVATFTADPAKASGLDGAVRTLGAAPFGKVLLVLAALGFAAFGVYSFARSRYCRL